LFQADSGEVFGLYTLVFQAYLEAFSEAWLSYFFGFGCHNLGEHLSRASLKRFRGTLKGFVIFFSKKFNHKSPMSFVRNDL